MSKRLLTAFATVLTVLLFFTQTVLAAKTEKDIKLRVKVKDGVLEPTKWGTTPSNCTRNKHEGCYEIPTNYYGNFELKLAGGATDCSNPDKWRLHSVVLGGESDVGDPQEKPSEWGNLSAGAAYDFNADQLTGIINFESNDGKNATFKDKNDHPHSIWYKVRVESCDPDREPGIIEYDPRVDNRGQPTG